MNGPRNPKAYARGQANRSAIRAVILEHVRRFPLARPLSGEQLRAHFPHLALSTIYWHLEQIRTEAQMQQPESIGIVPIHSVALSGAN